MDDQYVENIWNTSASLATSGEMSALELYNFIFQCFATPKHYYTFWNMYLYKSWALCMVAWVSNSEFDLTFQTWYVSLPNKNEHKIDIKFCPHWLGYKENFSL